MALATQCPYCHTTFKVAQDQLKLRAGLVRCGNCKQIFNGIEHLLPPEDAVKPISPPAPARPIAPTALDEQPKTSSEAMQASSIASPPKFEDEVKPALVGPEETSPTKVLDTPTDDPLQGMTLMDFSRSEESSAEVPSAPSSSTYDPDAPDPLSQTIDELRRKPLRASRQSAADDEAEVEAEEIDTEEDEPDFVVKGRRRQRIGRAVRLLMGVGAFLLSLSLLLQSAYVFHDQIAARLPAAKPLLAQMCQVFACQMGLPAQIDAVSLESSELQSVAPDKNVFVFNALLRNHGTTAQAWPNIELTLNDANEQPVARRIFTPHDYLPGTRDASNGFAAESERPIKLFLSLPQLKASGYRVYLFYP